LTFTPGLTKSNSHIFYTATDTVTDLVNTQHVGNRQHPVDRYDSERWFSCEQVIFLTMFCVFSLKKHAAKTQFSGFLFPGSAEALVS